MIEFKDNPNQENIIELRGIKQTYDEGRVKIIENLDFLVENKPDQGQFVVILGMSGSGKSTLLRYMAGLQDPTAGKVLVNNKPPSKTNRVSMVFQQYSSLPWMTVLENVGLALKFKGLSKKEINEKSMEIIELVGLAGHEHKFAQYPKLSGGQLQRVAIARSLLANSQILLMDEPFGALDVKTRIQMQDLLVNIWNKYHPTIVFVTHDISEAVFLADDIYIMKSAPSRFVEHIHVDLPLSRGRAIKREARYIELVQHVEDVMVRVADMG